MAFWKSYHFMREVNTFELGPGRFPSQCLLAGEVTAVQATSAASLLSQDGHVHFFLELIMEYLALLL